MDQSFYDLAEILICDPVASHRAATRSALYALGCRQIEIVANLRDFSEALDRRPPDLALCEGDVGAAELCRVIRNLRQSSQSHNPFIIVIVTAWATSATLAAEISNSGADGLLLRPFSAALLNQRIQTHVLRRRPFIVTDDYVGPERRADGTRPSSAVSFDPPNSLKAKIDGRLTPEEAIRSFEAELRAACTKLRAARMQRSA